MRAVYQNIGKTSDEGSIRLEIRKPRSKRDEPLGGLDSRRVIPAALDHHTCYKGVLEGMGLLDAKADDRVGGGFPPYRDHA
jgi:hypothetical protein